MNPIPFAYQGETIEHTQLAAGDTITVNGREVRVAGITYNPVSINNDGFVNGVQIIGTDALYDALTGEDRYSEIYPTLADNVEPEEFEKWLD